MIDETSDGRSRSSGHPTLWKRSAPTVVAGTLIALLSWPITPPEILWNIESSWRFGLQMAWARGFGHGTDIVFTYGPLGFLLEPEPFAGASSIAGLGVVGLIHLALSLVVVALALRTFPIWAAILVAYLGMRALQWLDAPERLLALVFLGCVELVRIERRPRIDSIAIALGGIVAGFALLGKTSIGVAVLGLVGLTALAVIRPRWRAVALVIGPVAISLAVLWVVAGQPLDGFWPFITGAYELVVGYSAAMGVDDNPTVHWQVLAYLACAGVVVTGAWQMSHSLGRVGRAWLLILCIGFLFATWKIGFVRWHSAWAILLAGAACFAFLGSSRARTRASLGLSVVLVAFLGVTQTEPSKLLDPSDSLADIARHVSLVGSADARRAELAATREELRLVYALDDRTYQLIRQRRVHIDPLEAGVAFAYQLSWRPVPIFQSYSAYTLGLDRRNADLLRSSEAPQRILRSPPITIDGRNPWFDAPAATVEMLCRYVHLNGTPGWQVLARGPSRCGDAELIAESSARTDEPVVVPTDSRPDHLIYVSIDGVNASLGNQLLSILVRGEEWFITTNGTERWRLVPGTANSTLIMSVPPDVDYPQPYGYGPSTTSIMVNAGLDGQGSSADLTFRFYSLPISPSQLSYSDAVARVGGP